MHFDKRTPFAVQKKETRQVYNLFQNLWNSFLVFPQVIWSEYAQLYKKLAKRIPDNIVETTYGPMVITYSVIWFWSSDPASLQSTRLLVEMHIYFFSKLVSELLCNLIIRKCFRKP